MVNTIVLSIAVPLLLMGFKLMAGAVASCALIGVAVGVGIIYGSLLISIGRNPSQRDELLRYAFIGFSLVEVSGLIGLVISLLLLFGFDSFCRIVNCSTKDYQHGIRVADTALETGDSMNPRRVNVVL